MRPLLAIAFFGAVVVTFVFISLPIIAIFTHVSPGSLLDQLSNPIVKDAILVTVKTTIVSQVIVLVFGTPTAYFMP